MERIPASERTREKLKAVIEGTEKGAGASELVRLAARLIIEEALEGEAACCGSPTRAARLSAIPKRSDCRPDARLPPSGVRAPRRCCRASPSRDRPATHPSSSRYPALRSTRCDGGSIGSPA